MSEIVDGRFVLLKDPVREGAAGQIVRAVDIENDGSPVAIKFIKGHRDDPTTRLFFQREADSLIKLDHPNIIRFIDAGWHEPRDRFYIALAWAEMDLDTRLRDRDWQTWDEFAERYAIPLLSGLAHAHLQSIVHRDIKPLNILLNKNVPMLADFGIAKIRDQVETLGLTTIAWQTKPYAPPDSCIGYEYTRDVWAIAVVFIEAMSTQRITDYPEINHRLSEIAVPPEIRRILQSCVDYEASLRPANATVFLQLLEQDQFSRRAKSSRSKAVLYLALTNRSRQDVGGDSPNDSEQVVLRDLINMPRAEFGFDHKKLKQDRETIYLYGALRKYVLKYDSTASRFMIVGAREFELYDAKREGLCGLGDLLTFSFANPGVSKAATAAQILASAIQQREENADDTSIEHGSEPSALLLDKYLAVLNAREELEQGDRIPVDYAGVKIAGRDIVFDLVQRSDADYTGQEWDIKVGTRRSFGRGEIVSQSESEIVMRFDRAPKNVPANGQLSPFLGPMQRSHERQLDAVSGIKDGSIPRPELANFLADPSSVQTPESTPNERWFREDLDGSKKAAVSAALGTKDFLIVEGPPGTGKTSFITEVVAQTLDAQPDAKILIVSQTHVAVDNALERLVDAGVRNVIRLSKPDDPKVSESVRPFILDKKMAEWAKGVQRKAEARIAKLAKDQGMPLRHLQACLLLQQLAVALGDISYVEERQKTSADPHTRRAETVSGVEQLRDREEMRERLDGLRHETKTLLAEVRGLLGDDLPLDDDTDRHAANAAKELLLSQGTYSDKLLSLVSLQGEWLQRVATDRNLVDAFLDTGSVLAGTCIGFLGHPAVRDLVFDLCILDEASKATSTEALVPLARSKKWILVGDTRQLPPLDEKLLWNKTMLSKYDLKEDFVKETVFERFVDKVDNGAKHLLREQYRMIRPIGDLISSTFYEGKLISPNTQTIPGLDRLGKPVLWISTSKLGNRRFEDNTSAGITSRSNRTEAKLAIEYLKTINGAIQRGLVLPPAGRKLSALLISPYKLQMDEMQRRLSQIDLSYIEISVQSVDAVQGREADLAVFSVTRSNTSGDLGFLRQEYWRRINVALSRARFSLTLLGDFDFCLDQPNALRDVALYMKRAPEDCEVRDA